MFREIKTAFPFGGGRRELLRCLARNLITRAGLLVLFCQSVHADHRVLEIGHLESRMEIGDYAHVVPQPGDELPELYADSTSYFLDRVENSVQSSPPDGNAGLHWQQSSRRRLRLNSDNGHDWLYVDIINTDAAVQQLLLELDGPDTASWYYRDHQNNLMTHLEDSGSPRYGRPVYDISPVIPLTLQPGVSYRIFISTYFSTDGRLMSVRLWNTDSFREQRTLDTMVDGLFFGFLGALIVYNLILYAGIREAVYLFFSGYQASIALFLYVAKGYGTIQLLDEHINLILPVFFVLTALYSIFQALFTTSLLNIRQIRPWLFRAWFVVIVYSLVHLPISIYLSYTNPSPGVEEMVQFQSRVAFLIDSHALIIFYQLGLIVYTVFFFWHRSVIARLWFLATGCYYLSLVVWMAFGVLGLEPGFNMAYAVQVTILLDGVLLSGLLAYRFRQEENIRIQAQQAALENLRLVNDAEQAKSTFISTVGHDLRQPVQAINFFVESLKHSASKKTRDVLTKIDGNIATLSTLLNSLLNLSRTSAHAGSTTIESFALHELLDGLKNEFEPVAADKGIALVFNTADCYVHSDKVGLSQILRNIIDNAIKYTWKGEVRVDVWEDTNSITISVTDTGIGIAETELEKIFEEFYQVPVPEGTPRTGVGLGLSIVSRLTRALNIRLQVSSRPGEGSCFELTVEKGVPSEQLPLVTAANFESLSGLKVLIVDGEESSADALRVLIESWGGEPRHFVSLETARESLAENSWMPDLLILDSALAEDEAAAGIVETLRSLKVGGIPMIVMTSGDSGDSGKEDRGAATAQADTFRVSKPVRPIRLRSLIQRSMALQDRHFSA